MKQWYQQTAEQSLNEIGSSRDGLSTARAAELLAEKGENVLKEGQKKALCRYSCLSLQIYWW